MLNFLWKNRTAVITGLFLLIAFLLFIMPPEAKLGNKVRLVYFHASIAENSIIFFVLGGMLAAGYLLNRKENSFLRAISLFLVGFYLWVIQTIIGAINMKVIWGNFFWTEPKARMGLILLVFSLFIYLMVELEKFSKILISVLLISMAILAIVALLFTSNVFHPKNAIFGSNVFAYKVIFVMLVLAWLVINYLWSESIFRKLVQGKIETKK
jgi:hypothetical protein